MIVDTHVLLWWAEDSPRLSRKARKLFGDPRTSLLWSAASTWELSIKAGIGRLQLPVPVLSYVMSSMSRYGMDSLAIEHSHAALVAELPRHHGDPFDRILIAQAKTERIPILTADPQFKNYDIEVVW
jgi:PIN domain nuclease of toxin-antitoxin system